MESAFAGCRGLDSVTIGNSVSSIGNSAFKDCSNLTSITIPDSMVSIGSDAFRGCNRLLFDTASVEGVKLVDGWVVGYTASIPADLDLSEGIRGVASAAFSGCHGLTNVTLPDSIKSIGDETFANCSCLANVVIPNSVKNIDGYAFAYCAGLSGVTIPDSVTNIGHRAFFKCSGMSEAIIGNSVSSIGEYAIFGCSGLTSVTIPAAATNISEYAFGNCSNIRKATLPGHKCDISLANVTNLVISAGTTIISDGAFRWCSSITSLTIPDSVTSIGYYAFDGCSSIRSVTIPCSVTNIGNYAFSGCTNIREATVPGRKCGIPFDNVINLVIAAGTTSINESAFSWCRGLTSVKIPDSVTSIGDGAFSGCNGLASVTIPDSVTSIGDRAFEDCSGLMSVTISDSVTSIGSSVFAGCCGLTSVSIPDSVTSIGESAFSGCTGLTSVTIPDSVTSIGRAVFYDCSGLTSVTIPDSVTAIADDAFSSCTGLTEVFLPEHLREQVVNHDVFYNCPNAVICYYDKYTAFLHGRLTTEESSETNIVLTAASDCKVTFDWKCSCEPLRKGKMYDYLSFSVDGEQLDAICGETDWTGKVFVIAGGGEHVLSWTYRKNEANSEGEDCGWIRVVRIVPRVELSFLPVGEETGEAPAAMAFYADDCEICLPGAGTLVWPKHSFLGWSDGETVFAPGSQYPCDAEIATLTAAWSRNELQPPEIAASAEQIFIGDTAIISITAEAGADIHFTLDGSAPTASSPLYEEPFALTEQAAIRAIAVKDDCFDSPEAMLAVIVDPTTFGEAANAPTFTFATGGAAPWRRVRGESPDSYALRSGAISHNATSRVEIVVEGDGIISFSSKVAGEVVYGEVYDGLAFLIDGVQQGELMGNADWATNTFTVAGEDRTRSRGFTARTKATKRLCRKIARGLMK